MKKIIFLLLVLFAVSCSHDKGELIGTVEIEKLVYESFLEKDETRARGEIYVKNNRTNVYIETLTPSGWESFGVYDYEYLISKK